MNLPAALVKSSAPIDRVIGQYVKLQRRGDELTGLCPFHDDHNIGSFFVDPNKDGGVFNCFACGAAGDVFAFIEKLENPGSFDAVVSRVAELAGSADSGRAMENKHSQECLAPPQQRTVAEYEYTDEQGEVLFVVQRLEPGPNGKKKSFRQYHLDTDGSAIYKMDGVRRVLFKLPEVIAADTVYVVEGEKDALTLASLGLVATTASGGASSKWLPEYSESLRGKNVIVIPDNDEPGIAHAEKIIASLAGVANARIVKLPEGKDVSDYIAVGHTREDLEALIAESRPKPTGLRTISQIVEEYGVEEILDPGSKAPGIMSPWVGLNEITGGFRPGQLIYLGARPAIGKTTLMAQLAHFVAKQGIGVPYFSLEMNSPELLHRFLAYLSGIPLNRYIRDVKTPEERRRCQIALGELCELPISIDDGTESTVESQVQTIKNARFDKPIGLVVVDYLGLMGSSEKAENRNQEISKISRALKVAAKRLRVPFIVASQLGRASERDDREPQLSDLRDSGSLEQDADIVLFLHRPNEQRGASVHPTTLIVAKQRQGPKGQVPLLFRGSSVRFEQAEPMTEAA
jgi:replicative DNA helicase